MSATPSCPVQLQQSMPPINGADAEGNESAAAANSKGGGAEATEKKKKKPVVCIIMGMAGSGKTTLLQRLNLYTAEMGIKSYFINLDPAVKQVPFGASIDIRDTVNYKEVRALIPLCCTYRRNERLPRQLRFRAPPLPQLKISDLRRHPSLSYRHFLFCAMLHVCGFTRAVPICMLQHLRCVFPPRFACIRRQPLLRVLNRKGGNWKALQYRDFFFCAITCSTTGIPA